MGRRVDLGGMTVAEGGRTTSRTNFLEVERAPVLVSATSKVKGGRSVGQRSRSRPHNTGQPRVIPAT